MVGFEYQGQSTNSIIGTPLLLVSYDSMDGLGMTRSKIEGERTVSRFITNEYGTMYEPLSFTYALIKSDYEPFTEREQRLVERWLTSPKLSSELRITNCEQYSYSYLGLFTSTRWEVGNGGFVICVFTFTVNGAYPYIFWEYDLLYDDVKNNYALDITHSNNLDIVNHGLIVSDSNEIYINGTGLYITDGDLAVVEREIPTQTFTIDCESDELDEYVYPIIKAKARTMDFNSSFELIQRTDNGRALKITTNSKNEVVIDCRHCRAYTVTQSNMVTHQLSFKELNWRDVDNVYWPRLIPGENELTLTGDVDFSIGFYAPYKKVGGWLI